MQAAPDTPLLYVLRNELGLHGPRFGCGLAQCGACTVHLNGAAVRSCIVPVGAARGKQVTTLETFATEKKPHPVVQAFIEEDAAQCGYCINGMVMQSVAFLQEEPAADRSPDQEGAEREHLPVRHALPHRAGGVAGLQGDGVREG